MSVPAPLTPSDADLQDFPFMPLHVARLRDSDLAAEVDPEACWYAVLLWGAAWHQLPAGSLPDNDAVLMRLVGLGRDSRTWKRHREGALRGFVKCEDGRLYHPVIAEQVIAAWDSKLHQRHRTLCAAVRKHNERKPAERRDSPDYETWLSLECPRDVAELVTAMSRVTGADVTRETASKRQGQGQGESPKPPRQGQAEPRDPEPPADVKAVLEAGGYISPPGDLGLLKRWYAAGADLDQDILPTIRRVGATLAKAPFTLKVFDAAIREKLAEDEREIQRLRRISERGRAEQQVTAQ